MINLCSASCNDVRRLYGFDNKKGCAKLGFEIVTVLQVAALAFAILGLLQIGPFKNMSMSVSYSLVGVSGFLLLLDAVYAYQSKKQWQGIIDGEKQLVNDLAAKNVKLTFNWRQWRYYIGEKPVATFSEFQKLSKKLVENSGFYYFRSIDGGIQNISICSRSSKKEPDTTSKKEPGTTSRRQSLTLMVDVQQDGRRKSVSVDDASVEDLNVNNCKKFDRSVDDSLNYISPITS